VLGGIRTRNITTTVVAFAGWDQEQQSKNSGELADRATILIGNIVDSNCYNSTSTPQRSVTFDKTENQVQTYSTHCQF